jgi:hypothetical protein
MVSQFGPQNWWVQFSDLGIKITAMVSCFGLQNQAGIGLSVAPQNRWREVNMEHASRSSGLLHVEVNRARVSQSGLKIGGGPTVGGVRGNITDVTSRTS